ncbi:MAG: hypothetical protein CMO01_01280 [Thalassobius sp.]|nr:hypothetical protein [Thalassovita sp.]
MKNTYIFLVLFFSTPLLFAQNTPSSSVGNNSNTGYKKRVLENAEIELLSSFYTQDGDNAAVTGGIGTEKLNDFATNINVAIPLNDDDVLTIDGTISAYTSASSSNLNPFSSSASSSYGNYSSSSVSGVSGASQSGGGGTRGGRNSNNTTSSSSSSSTTVSEVGSPWVASSGASRSDVWRSGSLSYSHTSDDRNTMYSGNISLSKEYDYGSFGAGLAVSKQFNDKNTEVGIKGNVYLDKWYPAFPTELKTYIENQGDLDTDYFSDVEILNADGEAIDKSSSDAWSPLNNYLITTDKRRTYSVSLSFSQIVNKNSQFSIFSDLIMQTGWLSNPMQRVYFSDIDNYYIGTASSISDYTDPSNTDVFQLADDIERLPDRRMKIPVGFRYHYYLNERFVVKSYYRFYFDDWGVISHTLNLELPIKLGSYFTFYPNYRFYTQTAAKYFAPYEEHVSTEQYYTSDYDLSAFYANQYGLGIKYTDILTKGHIGSLGLKNISLNYNSYLRSTGLKAHIVTLGAKFIIDKPVSKQY